LVIKLLLISTLIITTLSCQQKQSNKTAKVVKAKKFKQIAFLLYDNFDTALLNTAIGEATSFYNCKATILPPQDLPSFAFYEPRQRYKADSLIKFQSSILPAGAESVVGLTMKDISTSLGEKEDWGIFGLGYLPGKACIISVFRLKSTTYNQYRERFIKVLLHELGHNQGLPHCTFDSTCLMTDAKGTSAQVDKEKKWLCSHCSKLLSN
jgi:archaemetzincin